MTRVGHELAAVDIVDEDGGAVTVGAAWADRPAVLVFIRHFG